MPFSRQARIITLLVIDTVFFFIELITGYAVGSLALVADSFHMLNDVLSLVVALYTIKLATTPSSSANSYGWQRAEILGALINGVFLVALCVSIALEALGRIIDPPKISSPMVIVIVGGLGLLSNVVGLFLFHEHGHSHGHSHDEGAIKLPESDDAAEDDSRSDNISELYQHPAQARAQVIETAHEFGYGATASSVHAAMSPPAAGHIHHRAGSQSRKSAHGHGHARTGSNRPKGFQKPKSGSQSHSQQSQMVMPSSTADEIRTPYKDALVTNLKDSSTSASGSSETAVEDDNHAHNHDHDHDHDHDHAGHDHAHKHDHSKGQGQGQLAKNADEAEHGHSHDHGDDGHGHSHGGGGGGGHSHGSMNMRGVFLHVLGDALGNVGVIAAGLVIWFCHGRWTLYFDPGVSLLITCIIFSSALPLVKSASYILMQAVPSHVSLDTVRDSVYDVPGVVSVHELHIWQLSESTVVASVHVLIKPGMDYMDVANKIRGVMHGCGIHSVTIQPEFFSEENGASIATDTACLIRCPPDQCGGDTCCPPGRDSPSGPDGDIQLPSEDAVAQ